MIDWVGSLSLPALSLVVLAACVARTLVGLAMGYAAEAYWHPRGRKIFDLPLERGQLRTEILGTVLFHLVFVPSLVGLMATGLIRFAPFSRGGWLAEVLGFAVPWYGFMIMPASRATTASSPRSWIDFSAPSSPTGRRCTTACTTDNVLEEGASLRVRASAHDPAMALELVAHALEQRFVARWASVPLPPIIPFTTRHDDTVDEAPSLARSSRCFVEGSLPRRRRQARVRSQDSAGAKRTPSGVFASRVRRIAICHAGTPGNRSTR
jgi:hypothetical protein